MSIQKYEKNIATLSWEEIQYILEISFLSKKNEISIKLSNIRKMLFIQILHTITGNDFLIL